MNDTMRKLLVEMKQALDAFLSSPAAFRVVKTISDDAATTSRVHAKTLFILDSSFNPPQVAHLSLATAALAASRTRYSLPHRLLLLFSTHNADKSPTPAAFEHRLAMMVLFAQDLSRKLSASGEHGQGDQDSVAIDVGLTTKPYYNDKSAEIDNLGTYPGSPRHIHLVGFDTFTRIFTAKYYTSHSPPLSALDSFFEKHGLRITVRPVDDGGEYATAEAQKGYWRGIRDGEMEHEGGKAAWAEEIEMVDAEDEAAGVSSTRIRNAVEKQDWSELGKLCTPSVAEYVKEQGLYLGDRSKSNLA